MNNYYKIIIALGIIIIAGAGFWLYYESYLNIQNKYLEERKATTETLMKERVSQFATPDDFNSTDIERQDKVFKALFENIQTPELFRIKVYNGNYKIIWSNLKEVIGDDASNNEELEEAIKEGEVALELKNEKVKEERFSERGYENFTEIYVPVSNEQGERVGAIELYQAYDGWNEQIKNEFLNAAIKTIAGALLAFIALALIIRRFIPRQA